MKKKIFISFIIVFLTNPVFPQSMQLFWQIGQNDKSAAEFALGPYDFLKYSQTFGNKPVVYEVGKSRPETDFPFILPGPFDLWAGGASKQIVIRFGIKEMSGPCPGQLTVNYVETHFSPPMLQFLINDYQLIVQAPAGDFNGDFRRHNSRILPWSNAYRRIVFSQHNCV